MNTADESNVPKPWDDEFDESILPDLLGDTASSLPDDVFERILAEAMQPDSPLADGSLIPSEDDPALTEDGAFVDPEAAETFLAAAFEDDEDREEEEIEVEFEDHDGHEDLGGSDFGEHDFSSADFDFEGESNDSDFGDLDGDSDGDLGGVWV